MNNIANIITSKLIKLKRKIRRIAQKTNKTEHKNLANRLKILASKAMQNDRTHGGKQKHKKLIRQKTVKICGKTFTKLAVKEHRQRLTTLLLKRRKSNRKRFRKSHTLAETLGGIHNTHKGPIFDDNFKKEVDDKIAENYHLFNPLASYVDEKGDDNPMMGHIRI